MLIHHSSQNNIRNHLRILINKELLGLARSSCPDYIRRQTKLRRKSRKLNVSPERVLQDLKVQDLRQFSQACSKLDPNYLKVLSDQPFYFIRQDPTPRIRIRDLLQQIRTSSSSLASVNDRFFHYKLPKLKPLPVEPMKRSKLDRRSLLPTLAPAKNPSVLLQNNVTVQQSRSRIWQSVDGRQYISRRNQLQQQRKAAIKKKIERKEEAFRHMLELHQRGKLDKVQRREQKQLKKLRRLQQNKKIIGLVNQLQMLLKANRRQNRKSESLPFIICSVGQALPARVVIELEGLNRTWLACWLANQSLQELEGLLGSYFFQLVPAETLQFLAEGVVKLCR